MAEKLTPWFPNSVKPRRVGVYERHYGGKDNVGFAFWNGCVWGYRAESPDGAVIASAVESVTRCRWRGLAKEPK